MTSLYQLDIGRGRYLHIFMEEWIGPLCHQGEEMGKTPCLVLCCFYATRGRYCWLFKWLHLFFIQQGGDTVGSSKGSTHNVLEHGKTNGVLGIAAARIQEA